MNTKRKRRYPRIVWTVDATYQMPDNEHGRQAARTIDVSDGGALLSVNDNLAPGTLIDVKFRIDRFELGPERARVIRNDSAFGGSESLMAVEFESPHRGLAMAVEFDREKKRWNNSKLMEKRL